MRLMLFLDHGLSKSEMQEGTTVSNYVQLILTSQNHEHAGEIAEPDKTLFNIKGFFHILWAAA